jgi:hypothetical protein
MRAYSPQNQEEHVDTKLENLRVVGGLD